MSGLSLRTRMSNLKSVALTVLEPLAFNAQKFRRSRDTGHPCLLWKFLELMSGLSLGTRVSNLKSVASTVLELLAFNAQKFWGSRDRGHAPFWENFWGSCSDCHWEHVCQIWSPYLWPFWSCWHLTPKNLGGSRDRGHAPFWENFRYHVRTVPGKPFVKFEVRSFNSFGAIGN